MTRTVAMIWIFKKFVLIGPLGPPLGTSAAGSAGCFHFISFHFISFHFSPRAGRRGRGERQVHAG